MLVFIDIVWLAIINIIIIDKSGIIGSLEEGLKRWLKVRKVSIPRPFSCPLCMTFWSGLAYLILTNNISLMMIAYLLFISYLTPVISELLSLVYDTLMKIITWLD